jgi:hypothetical protein
MTISNSVDNSKPTADGIASVGDLEDRVFSADERNRLDEEPPEWSLVTGDHGALYQPAHVTSDLFAQIISPGRFDEIVTVEHSIDNQTGGQDPVSMILAHAHATVTVRSPCGRYSAVRSANATCHITVPFYRNAGKRAAEIGTAVHDARETACTWAVRRAMQKFGRIFGRQLVKDPDGLIALYRQAEVNAICEADSAVEPSVEPASNGVSACADEPSKEPQGDPLATDSPAVDEPSDSSSVGAQGPVTWTVRDAAGMTLSTELTPDAFIRSLSRRLLSQRSLDAFNAMMDANSAQVLRLGPGAAISLDEETKDYVASLRDKERSQASPSLPLDEQSEPSRRREVRQAVDQDTVRRACNSLIERSKTLEQPDFDRLLKSDDPDVRILTHQQIAWVKAAAGRHRPQSGQAA